MAVVYLGVNALMYVFLGVWCAIKPRTTAQAIGFEFSHPSAQSEYLTVYGGLEIGLGIFFFLGALWPSWRMPALGFGMVLYTCLALFRGGSLIFLNDLGRFPYLMFTIEATLAVSAWILVFRARNS